MILQYLYERDKWVDQVQENSARQAFAWGSFESTGFGTLSYPDSVDFGVTFIHEPWVSYGCSVRDAEVLDDLPSCTGGVYEFRQDDRGFYTGAHVFVVVDEFGQNYWVDPIVVHYFSFTGVAIKDIGADQFTDH